MIRDSGFRTKVASHRTTTTRAGGTCVVDASSLRSDDISSNRILSLWSGLRVGSIEVECADDATGRGVLEGCSMSRFAKANPPHKSVNLM